MRRSSGRILTTHVGSLPAKGSAAFDRSRPDFGRTVREEVRCAVAMQSEIGIDIQNEGEHAKGGDWLSYIEGRLGGFEARPPGADKPYTAQGRDREEFADFYRYAVERGTLFYTPGKQVTAARPSFVCTGPIVYRGAEALAGEIALTREFLAPPDAFITSTAPASLEPYRRNEFYRTDEEFLYAIGEAMKVEYDAIAKAGFLLQVDDAWLPAMWDRIGIAMGLEGFRKWCLVRVEVLNYALRDIPEEQIRYHLCWGSWHGPHAFDIEMADFADIMLRVKAQAYLFEAANARHEHEWEVWENVRLPDGKILAPGVVTHSTDVVEHPDLVAQRIVRFAERVGREHVIAGTDCGFGGRSHPQIAWAKMRSLVEGARRASRRLGF